MATHTPTFIPPSHIPPSRFPALAPELLVALLAPPEASAEAPVWAVLDTETINEIDDQFALAYAVLSGNISLEAVYAAPFHNARSSGPGDGMEKSYREIHRVLDRIAKRGAEVPRTVLRGSDRYLTPGAVSTPGSDPAVSPPPPVSSPAAADLVEKAMGRRDSVLYVVAIGAATNVASALLLEPRIRERIVVVWLAGHPYTWPTAREFNLRQDPAASRVVFDSGVPLVHVPCKNVAEHLAVTVPELASFLEDGAELCRYLYETTREYIAERGRLSKPLWDVATVAWLRNPDWVPTALVPRPLLTSELTWSADPTRPLARVALDVRRDAVFRDLFGLLGG